MSKYKIYKEEIKSLARSNDFNTNKVARILSKQKGVTFGGALRRYCNKVVLDLSQVKEDLNERGVASSDFRHGWIKTKQGSYFIKNENVINYDEIREQFIQDVKDYAPVYPKIKYDFKESENLLLLDIADLHINKLTSVFETGEANKNIESLKQTLFNKIEVLIKRTNSFNITSIIFVGGNDVLHTDSPQNTTTAGTKQDVSMMWFDAFVEARKLYIEILERLLLIAPVHFVFTPSNHDYMSGFHLAQNIQAWFHKNNNISFDVSPAHRKYIQFGASLIGLTHGDGAKEADLPDLMKIEAKEGYYNSNYCYWYTHHIHHKDKSSYKGKQKVQLEKDYRDVKVINTGKKLHSQKNRTHVEYLRSANGTDSWHHRKGYQHSPIGIECFVHSVEGGQIGSFFE
jgi:hypothetical protein